MKNEEFKQKIKDFNWLAELSGVPVEVIEEIFSGNRRYEIMASLGNLYDPDGKLQESVAYTTDSKGPYTVEDYMALPEAQRFELIDGYLYRLD